MSDRSELIAEANDLGLEFKKNISSVKLSAMIEAATDIQPVKETAPASPAAKPDKPSDPIAEAEPEITVARTPADIAKAKHLVRRRMIAKARAKAFKTQVVTLTNKDNRENDVVTTAYLAFENQYFGLAKNVPLDVPVELEAALLSIAASCKMTLHKAEVINGKATGNRITVTVKKYAISYSRQEVDAA